MITPSHKPHQELCRLSMIQGKAIAFAAFKGATYHLSFINNILDNAEKRTGPESFELPQPFMSQKEVNEVHWHLRSFFWELIGSFDLMLQWVNDRFALGIEEDKVLWRNIPKSAGRDQELWGRVHQTLTAAWNGEWLFEIRMYRNFAHRSFLQLTSLVGRQGDAQVFLSHAREGQQYYVDIREHLKKSLEEMRNLGAMVFVD